MYISRSTLIALLASPLLAFAQSTANPFNVPTSFSGSAGKTLDLNWKPTTSGTVSLILRSGASSNLNAGTYIAQGIQNSGSYSWTIPSEITRGSDYAVEIVDDADNTQTNFSPYFVIESSNTVAYSTSEISMAAPSSSLSLSTASASASVSSLSATSTMTGGMTLSTMSSMTSSGSMSSMTGSMTGSMTSSMSGSVTGSSSGTASRTSSGASFQASSAAASATASAQSTGGAPRATAAAGVMGLIVLGALAL